MNWLDQLLQTPMTNMWSGGDDPRRYGIQPWNTTSVPIPPNMVAPWQGGVPARVPQMNAASPAPPPAAPPPDMWGGEPGHVFTGKPPGLLDMIGTPTQTERDAFRSMFGGDEGTRIRITPENTLPSRTSLAAMPGALPPGVNPPMGNMFQEPASPRLRNAPGVGEIPPEDHKKYTDMTRVREPRASVATAPGAPPPSAPPAPPPAAMPGALPPGANPPVGNMYQQPAPPPASAAAAPSWWERNMPDKDSPVWGFIAQTGAGLGSAAPGESFLSAANRGLAGGNQFLQTQDDRKLKRMLLEGEVGEKKMKIEQRRVGLEFAKTVKDKTARVLFELGYFKEGMERLNAVDPDEAKRVTDLVYAKKAAELRAEKDVKGNDYLTDIGKLYRDLENAERDGKPALAADLRAEIRQKTTNEQYLKTEQGLGKIQKAIDTVRTITTDKDAPSWAMRKAFPGQKETLMSQAITDLQIELKELYALGVLNGPDYMLIQRVLPDITSVNPFGGAFWTGLGTFQKQLDFVQGKLDDARSRWTALHGRTQPPGTAVPGATPARRLKYNPNTGQVE